MRIEKTNLNGVFQVLGNAFEDNRGSFRREFCKLEFKKNGIEFSPVQGNISKNKQQYTLRGFHYQKKPSKETKLLTPITGSIYNIVVDLRKESKTFLKWQAFKLTANDNKSLFVPVGCANAFLTLEKETIIHYHMGDYFKDDTYCGFRYNDPFFNFSWPKQPLVISEKDNNYENMSNWSL